MRDNTQYFAYLRKLRRKGITNRIGATLYLQKDFNLSHKEAKKIIDEWNRRYAFTN